MSDATAFRTAPIPAWGLAAGDTIVTDDGGDEDRERPVEQVHARDVVRVLLDLGEWREYQPDSPVLVKAPSGPHPVDGWTGWWRTPNEYSPCTCLHRPTGVPGNWAPTGFDEHCREHAGAGDWDD